MTERTAELFLAGIVGAGLVGGIESVVMGSWVALPFFFGPVVLSIIVLAAPKTKATQELPHGP